MLDRWLERLPDWVPGPRRVFVPFATLVLALLAPGLWFDETRWNMVTEAWGAAGAAVVIWWVLERHSEAVQRHAWVRRHADQLVAFVSIIHDSATTMAVRALGLPTDINQGLRGPSRDERRRAAQRAAGDAEAGRQQLDAARARFGDRLLRIDVELGSAVQRDLADANEPLLSRLPDLHAAITRHSYSCREFLRWAPSLYPWEQMRAETEGVDPALVDETQALLVQRLGSAALELSEICSDVLREARALR